MIPSNKIYQQLEDSLWPAMQANCEAQIVLQQRGDKFILGVAILHHFKDGITVEQRMQVPVYAITTTDKEQIAQLHRIEAWGAMKTHQYLIEWAKVLGAK